MKKIITSYLFLISFFPLANINAQAGEALNFDGVNDYISLNLIPQLAATQTASMEFWVKPFSTGGHKHFISYQNGNMALKSDGGGSNIHFQLGTGTTIGGSTSGGVLSAGTWVHIAGVYDGTQTGNENRLKLYINGVQTALNYVNTVPASLPNIGTHFHIGKWSPGDFGWIHAEMDEVRIWDIALTESEIMARKDCELSGQESGLVTYFQFNEGTIGANNAGLSTAPDISGNGINGMLQNFGLDGATSNWAGPSIVSTGTACPGPIPTMGEWSLIIFGLVVASFGVITVMRWQRSQQIHLAH